MTPPASGGQGATPVGGINHLICHSARRKRRFSCNNGWTFAFEIVCVDAERSCVTCQAQYWCVSQSLCMCECVNKTPLWGQDGTMDIVRTFLQREKILAGLHFYSTYYCRIVGWRSKLWPRYKLRSGKDHSWALWKLNFVESGVWSSATKHLLFNIKGGRQQSWKKRSHNKYNNV